MQEEKQEEQKQVEEAENLAMVLSDSVFLKDWLLVPESEKLIWRARAKRAIQVGYINPSKNSNSSNRTVPLPQKFALIVMVTELADQTAEVVALLKNAQLAKGKANFLPQSWRY